ncbi:ImmA/IrrE family metallo-endopeptidase [Spirochaeta cellobiosiphila]|uniref:ImmA/IrrE family metallo-endopeptidase n=1 Tax=Spirochaeta cellobiosiphila TaxID=504483 RepID=UPI00042A3D64|nr:ImmA/IrrE family metallo-endopeptidase [Spirochaeta cellobiosiphila]
MKTERAPEGFRVKPRSVDQIRKIALNLKDMLIRNRDYVPIVPLLEALAYNEVIDYEIIEDCDIESDTWGYTLLGRNSEGGIIPFIRIPNKVYAGALKGDGFHRFTIAHEIGHAILHKTDLLINFIRAERSTSHRKEKKWYEDSEWQANTFASELLADIRSITTADNEITISNKFGISRSAARTRIGKLIRDKKRLNQRALKSLYNK